MPALKFINQDESHNNESKGKDEDTDENTDQRYVNFL